MTVYAESRFAATASGAWPAEDSAAVAWLRYQNQAQCSAAGGSGLMTPTAANFTAYATQPINQKNIVARARISLPTLPTSATTNYAYFMFQLRQNTAVTQWGRATLKVGSDGSLTASCQLYGNGTGAALSSTFKSVALASDVNFASGAYWLHYEIEDTVTNVITQRVKAWKEGASEPAMAAGNILTVDTSVITAAASLYNVSGDAACRFFVETGVTNPTAVIAHWQSWAATDIAGGGLLNGYRRPPCAVLPTLGRVGS